MVVKKSKVALYIDSSVILLGPAVGQNRTKLIVPEFVSYLGERGLLCVETDRHSLLKHKTCISSYT